MSFKNNLTISLPNGIVTSQRHSDMSSMKRALDWKSLDNTQLFSLQDTSKKSPMELISEVPPIKVEGRIVACEGGNDSIIYLKLEILIVFNIEC